jgi:hypothetical protein
MWGFGLPEGSGISTSDWLDGLHALRELRHRILEVRANPDRFSEYTVKFVESLPEEWPRLPEPEAESDLDRLGEGDVPF